MPLEIPKSGPLKGRKVYVDIAPRQSLIPNMQKLKPLSHDAPAESWAKPLLNRGKKG